jgi:TfoX/Sxy family transcriptional regulator of competence genes
MAYDEELVTRIRDLIDDRTGVEEKKMFGGLTFMVNGNMACGVTKDVLVVRVGADHYEEALGVPFARECDFTGRPLKSMVMVDRRGFESSGDLRAWVERGVRYARSMPIK